MLVIFDLDDTLVETSKCLTPAYLKRAFEAMTNKGLETDLFSELLRINQTALSSKEAIKIFCEQVGTTKEILSAGLEAMHLPIAEELKIEPTRGAIKLLEDLKGVKLCLVTLGDRALQISKMEKAGIQPKQFSKLVVGKGPSKKFDYQMILEEFSPDNCIVCGDRVPIDLSPAKALGLTTVHYRNGRGRVHDSPKEDVDLSIENIEEIKNLL